MRRREFIRLISGSTALLSLTAHAQQPDRKRRIGVLMGIADNDPEARPRVEAFERGLQELGWADGQNIHLDYRWTAGDPDGTLLFAKEIFDLKPDVILVHSSPAVAALRQLTSKIPLVFVLIADPIGSGFVASLAHPGGNATGFMNAEATLAGKWLGLIKEIAPKIEQVALKRFSPGLNRGDSQTVSGDGVFCALILLTVGGGQCQRPILVTCGYALSKPWLRAHRGARRPNVLR